MCSMCQLLLPSMEAGSGPRSPHHSTQTKDTTVLVLKRLDLVGDAKKGPTPLKGPTVG